MDDISQAEYKGAQQPSYDKDNSNDVQEITHKIDLVQPEGRKTNAHTHRNGNERCLRNKAAECGISY